MVAKFLCFVDGVEWLRVAKLLPIIGRMSPRAHLPPLFDFLTSVRTISLPQTISTVGCGKFFCHFVAL